MGKSKIGVKNLPPLLQTGELIRDRYQVEVMIGGGGFGQIFRALDKTRDEKVAIKIEPEVSDSRRMYLEHCILLSLVGKSHIPMMRCSGQIRGCSFIAMDLLGRNLSELRRREKSRTFSFGTTYRIAPQILDGLRHIHDIGYLHRDAFKLLHWKQAHDRRMIYILDFGMTRQYRNPDGKTRRAREYAGFRGTIRYASPRVHARQESGPADDLISLLYSVVELGDGTLPWTHIREPAQVEKSKTQTKLSILCEKQPIELLKFAEVARHTTCFRPNADYELIISLFQKCVPAGVSVATLFDWELKEHRTKAEVKEHPSAEKSSIDLAMWILNRTSNRCLTIGMYFCRQKSWAL
uniref:Protein kinase domain-containing protein n=1 Tax=Ditylenchus dipsaci TaxID=166011 RepID=A0A915CSI4_9BILA